MGEDAGRNASVSAPEDWPIVIVPGRIVFQSDRDGALGEIWLLDRGQLKKLASSNRTPADLPKEIPALLHTSLAELQMPKWSPDGSKILCIAKEELVILFPDGTVEERIRPSGVPHLAMWAPNGKSIYFTKIDKAPQGGGSLNIYCLNLVDHSETRVTNLKPMPGTRSILSFTVSPDDRTIVFCMVGEKEYGISLWRIGTDGSRPELFVKYADDPAWSPDGSRLAYVSRHAPTGQRVSEFDEIFVLDLKSGQTIQITHNRWADRCPVFSPDGKKLAFQSARHREIAHGAEFFVINLDGTGEARLTPPHPNPEYPNDPIRGWATDEHPDWAP